MIDYQLAFNIIVAISTITFGFFCIMSWWYIFYFFVSTKKTKEVPHSDKKTKFAILVAARNESKVISGIFESLKKQTYNPEYFDVWAIVEDPKDKTIKIAEKYGYKTFLRDKLDESRKTKGFAIQECIDYFMRNEIHYDAYMIFDADNLLEPRYIEVMNDLRQSGVKVGLGYRNFTNASENWLTCCSATMFSYMNQITSKGRSYLFHKATLMGTGYYIDSSIIEDIGGWIFTGMTEDIQLSAYCVYHDVYMRYYPLVQFFDEQSPKFKDVHNQHLRWLAGYFHGRSFLKRNGVDYPYHSKGMQRLMRTEFKLGVFPFVIFNVVTVLLFIASLVLAICSCFFAKDLIAYCFGLTAYQFLLLYVSFIIASGVTIAHDNKNLKFNFATKLWAISTYMFFFYDFGFAFIDGLFHKEKRTNWKKIQHTGEITNKELQALKKRKKNG